jgi:hypothetical protein
MYNTGFHWLAGDVDMVSNGTYVGGAAASWVTKERLDADVAANKIAIWDVQGAKRAVIAPLLGNYADGEGSGGTWSSIDVYGVMEQGLPGQTNTRTERCLVHLMYFRAARVSSGNATGTGQNTTDVDGLTNIVFTHPVTNSPYQTAFTRGGLTVEEEAEKFQVIEIEYPGPGDIAGPDDTDFQTDAQGDASVHDGTSLTTITGLAPFQQLVLSFDAGSLACNGNALMARLY